jgi:hypothetical protein
VTLTEEEVDYLDDLLIRHGEASLGIWPTICGDRIANDARFAGRNPQDVYQAWAAARQARLKRTP